MSRDPRRIFEEARKSGGFPLYGKDGYPLMVPEKIMRCPECNGKVEKKSAARRVDRTSPEGQPIYRCKACHIEFTQVTKRYYCTFFKKNIFKKDCLSCHIGRDKILAWRNRINLGETELLNQAPCEFLQNRLGMDWAPEEWDRDTHIK